MVSVELVVEPIWDDFDACPCCDEPPPVHGDILEDGERRATYLGERPAPPNALARRPTTVPVHFLLAIQFGGRAISFDAHAEAGTLRLDPADRHPDWSAIEQSPHCLDRQEASVHPRLAEMRSFAEAAWRTDQRLGGSPAGRRFQAV